MDTAAERGAPLLDLQDVRKFYGAEGHEVRALDGVSLSIRAGEFVAVMGQSGSGKSTLMNILGCLDTPSSGTYHVKGRDVRKFDADGLATLRREMFGFIFQRYNLLGTATAAENVEIPAIYAGMDKTSRAGRARQLLARLGLGERLDNRPGQLSGGQQQRVAIARALVNNPPIILADEPTGALDSRSGEEVMALLKDLHAEGRTVIVITHDAQVAAHAHRLITIKDGQIESDEVKVRDKAGRSGTLEQGDPALAAAVPEVGEAAKMAMRSLKVNLFRTALTLLGIVIGVASVVAMLAVGSGSKQSVLDRMSAMGTNVLSIRPGAPGIRSSGDMATLTAADADAIAGIPNVQVAVPQRDGRETVRYGNVDYATSVSGVGTGFPIVKDWALSSGNFFTDRDLQGYAAVAVLGQTVVDDLFGPGSNPIGQYILVGNIPFEVIGVLEKKGASFMGSDQDDVVVVPLTTAIMRLFGGTYVNGITVRVADVAQIDATQDAIHAALLARHRVEDFSIRNMASIMETANAMGNTLTILLGTIAAISLLVGGIGVMNIMLVSVTERTREIGIRMATGARQRDIMVQFITEAGVVCTLGGLLGVALGVAVGVVLKLFGMNVAFSPWPALLAFGCAVATGLLFGYLPARQAARLDPVKALVME